MGTAGLLAPLSLAAATHCRRHARGPTLFCTLTAYSDAHGAMAAVPPSKLSKRVQCTVGVSQAEPGTCTAFLTWQRPQQQAGGRPALVAEHLGHLHPKPWLAGVAHDVALCSRAFHSGNRTLAGVTHLGGGGASGERLNFPLSSYTSSLSFWDALDKYSFGELALKLRSSRELVKVCGGGCGGLGRLAVASFGAHHPRWLKLLALHWDAHPCLLASLGDARPAGHLLWRLLGGGPGGAPPAAGAPAAAGKGAARW